MSWRTVVITRRCKLDYKMGYLVIRSEETKRIFLEEISILMIENPAVSLTGCLLEELIYKKIRVIFCDSKRTPLAELMPYYGSFDCSRKAKTQAAWNEKFKGLLWAEIVAEKIRNQAAFLKELGHAEEAELIESYVPQIEPMDKTNREGHAAKVYFNALFGMDFTRTDDSVTNAALNYGYGLLLSSVSREIAVNGYLTQMGIFHDNMFNPYNLSCDLMEPFRILVDRLVLEKAFGMFETDQKHEMLKLFEKTVVIRNSRQSFLNAVRIYVRSVFESLNNEDLSELQFYKPEKT